MSTSAGRPEPDSGQPPTAPSGRRGLRDSRLGRIALLALVLFAAFVATRSCASRDQNISKDEAIQIARDEATFEPCDQTGCVLIRAVNQGIPVRLYWIVGLAEELGPGGKPVRVENFLVDAETGEITRR